MRTRSIGAVLTFGTLVAAMTPVATNPVCAQQEGVKQSVPGGASAARRAPTGLPGPRAVRPSAPSVRSIPGPARRIVGPSPAARRLPAVTPKPPSIISRRLPSFKPTPQIIRPPIVRQTRPSAHRHAHRPWRRGHRWRWIAVPTIIIAQNLEWCHYHTYRVSGMRFHRDVECHQHERWNHPSIRYVEGY
jgi:hypothetical protein